MEMFAISVITPLYNAEKYLPACLNSLLAQTFQNFELIIVDDCSTDSSCAIVESYAPKFGGRLTLSHMETNSGSGALPRNKGLMLSRGEYIFFADADDLLTKTALEEMYALAKKFDADVVHCEKHYEISYDGTKRRGIVDRGTLVNKPTLETRNLAQVIPKILNNEYRVEPWRKLVRRNFLMEHEIFFSPVKIHEDTIWTYALIFYAKSFLLVPNAVYLWRQNNDSIMRATRTAVQTVNFWLNPLLLGLNELNKLMSRHEFFKENPQYQYDVTEKFVRWIFGNLFMASQHVAPADIYAAIKQEYGNSLGEHDILIAALCTALNSQQKTTFGDRQKFQQFAKKARARVANLEAELKRLQS